MKSNIIRQRLVSVLLLLVFFQQVGAGLYIHNLFHDKEQPAQLAHDQMISEKEIIMSCSCVDNFLMPFIDAASPEAPTVFQQHLHPVDLFSEEIYFSSLIFSALRGPPVA